MKTTIGSLAAATFIFASPAAAQVWHTTSLPKDEGIGAQSTNSDYADILVWCSDEIPGVTIGFPLDEVPQDIGERMKLFVDGEELRDTAWGFDLAPAGGGAWIKGDANAQWHTVRRLIEKIARGDRLTVMVPSLGFATNFELQGARSAIAPIMQQCGLNP